MLHKHAACFGNQWDQYLSGVLWAYRNTPHKSTGEKPSFLLFGLDCRSPTEATLLPTHPLEPTDISDYREELMLSLSSARDLAAKSVCQAQRKYKTQYDRKATQHKYRIGDWVLVRFPDEESGKQRKLSRPWHGPYRVLSRNDRDITVINVYFPKTTRFKLTNQESGLAHQNSLQDIIGMGRPKRDPDSHPSGLTSCCRKKNYLTSMTLKRAPHTTILWILNPVVKRSRKTSHLQVISHSLETCIQSQSRVVLMLPQEHSLPTMV